MDDTDQEDGHEAGGIIPRMADHVFLCQTPFHVLASEAVVSSLAEEGHEIDPSFHLVYFGRAAVDPVMAPWTSRRIVQRPRVQLRTGPLRARARDVGRAWLDFARLVATSRYVRRRIEAASDRVIVYVPHFEGALANDLLARSGGRGELRFRAIPDGILDAYSVVREHVTVGERIRATVLNAAGIRYRWRLGDLKTSTDEHVDVRYSLLEPSDSAMPDPDRVQHRVVSLAPLRPPATVRDAPAQVVLLGQEPIIARWGEARYLSWVQGVTEYLRLRYPVARLLYKPHHSGPHLHRDHALGVEILDDERPLERLLGERHIVAVASLASTALLTAKLILGNDVDALSVDGGTSPTSSRDPLKRDARRLMEALARYDVEVVVTR